VRLRRGVSFHDVPPVSGGALTTDDVLQSWRRLTATESPNASQARGITRVEAVDGHTLRVELDAPSATFLDVLADANRLWVLPRESDGRVDPARTAIGTGPWVHTTWQSGTSLEFRRHAAYFVEGKPFVDGVHVSILPEQERRLSAFQASRTHLESI